MWKESSLPSTHIQTQQNIKHNIALVSCPTRPVGERWILSWGFRESWEQHKITTHVAKDDERQAEPSRRMDGDDMETKRGREAFNT